MARILAISSQVVFGPVGLSAIVPALQAEGHEVLALPTVVLSNHPGHGKPIGAVQDIASMIAALQTLDVLKNIDAVLTGYFATAAQVDTVAVFLKQLHCSVVLVDPVIGDHGRLYVGEDVAIAVRDQLLPLATIVTPNVFELSWLSGIPVLDRNSAIAVAQSLKIEKVIVTSVPMEGEKLGTVLIQFHDITEVISTKLNSVPHGTGDYLSGLFLARQFSNLKTQALQDSVEILQRAIALSGDTGVLAVAEALHKGL